MELLSEVLDRQFATILPWWQEILLNTLFRFLRSSGNIREICITTSSGEECIYDSPPPHELHRQYLETLYHKS